MDIITYALSKKGIINVDGKQYKPELKDGEIVYKKIDKPGEYTTFILEDSLIKFEDSGEMGIIIVNTYENSIKELYVNNTHVEHLPLSKLGDEEDFDSIEDMFPVYMPYIVKAKKGDQIKIKGSFSLYINLYISDFMENTVSISNVVLQNDLEDCSYMFAGTNLTEVPVIPNSVTNCDSMFYCCSSLTEAPEIPNSVTNCSWMFGDCTSLTEAPIIPSSVTNCSSMFNNCTSLTEAPIIPNSVTDCSWMFFTCTNLTEAPIIPEGVTDCNHMFCGCTSLTEASVIPNSVTNCSYMFMGCTNLTEAPIILEGVIDCSSMFDGCASLTEAPVIPSSVTNCSYMFNICTSLTTLPSENVDLIYNHNDELQHDFCYSGCTNIINPITINDIPVEWGGNKVEEKPGEYTTFTVGEAGELCVLSVDTNPITELYINNVVQELPIKGNPLYVSCGTKYLVNLGDIVKIKGGFTLGETTLAINNIVLQNNLTNCSSMFQKCSALTEAPVIPNSVTNCSSMFEKCGALTEAPVIPEGVTDCSRMFNGCTGLTEAPVIPNSVTNCVGMFQNCKKLTEAPVIPEGITNCNSMFSGCSALTEAPVIPNSVTDCSYMFSNCSALTEAPVIPEGVTDCSRMFQGCTNLTTLPPENVELLSNYPSFLNYEKCYGNCTNIITPITYAQIPDDWKN